MIPAWFIHKCNFSLAVACYRQQPSLTAFLVEHFLQMEHIVKASKVGEILGRCVVSIPIWYTARTPADLADFAKSSILGTRKNCYPALAGHASLLLRQLIRMEANRRSGAGAGVAAHPPANTRHLPQSL
jgi:hypothetical protein